MTKYVISIGTIALCTAMLIGVTFHEAPEPNVRLLEWDWFNRADRFKLDGKEYGCGAEGIEAVEKEVRRGDTLRIVTRTGMEGEVTPWSMPDELLIHWLVQGVNIEFRYQQKWLRAHYLTWKGFDPLAKKPGKPRYIFDGRHIGKGADGLRNLREIQLQPDSIVFVIYPLVIGPSSPPSIWPEGLDEVYRAWLRLNKARFGGELFIEGWP